MNALAIPRTDAAHDAPLTIRDILARRRADRPAGDRLRRPSRATRTPRSRARRPARLGPDRTRRQAGLHGRRHGLGQPPLPRMLFAVPMMGAVLHTVNVRLSPEQILYTINHARDDVILRQRGLPAGLEAIQDRIEPVQAPRADRRRAAPGAGPACVRRRIRGAAAAARRTSTFPDFDENTRATTFYTTGTTGLPKGVYFSHRQLVLHTLATARRARQRASMGTLHRGDVYMPITPMFHVHAWGMPYRRDDARA